MSVTIVSHTPAQASTGGGQSLDAVSRDDGRSDEEVVDRDNGGNPRSVAHQPPDRGTCDEFLEAGGLDDRDRPYVRTQPGERHPSAAVPSRSAQRGHSEDASS